MQSETKEKAPVVPGITANPSEHQPAAPGNRLGTATGSSQQNALDKYRAALDQIISYLERLGVCVAALVGSAAIIYFRNQILEIAPFVPAATGSLAFLASLFLTIWVAADQLVRIPTGKSRFWSGFAAAAVLVPTICFVLAGLFGALNGFAP